MFESKTVISSLSKSIDANVYSSTKIKKQDEESLGILFSFFILETIILARTMNVNPFDQPAVEQIKIETKNFLNY